MSEWRISTRVRRGISQETREKFNRINFPGLYCRFCLICEESNEFFNIFGKFNLFQVFVFYFFFLFLLFFLLQFVSRLPSIYIALYPQFISCFASIYITFLTSILCSRLASIFVNINFNLCHAFSFNFPLIYISHKSFLSTKVHGEIIFHTIEI